MPQRLWYNFQRTNESYVSGMLSLEVCCEQNLIRPLWEYINVCTESDSNNTVDLRSESCTVVGGCVNHKEFIEKL